MNSVEDTYKVVRQIAIEEFSDIVIFTERVYGKLRIHLIDGSFLDVWFSRKIPGRYAYHWERRAIDGSIYRHDNRPHEYLRSMESFPKHFHDGNEGNVKESTINENPEKAIREFLNFVRLKLEK